MSVQYFFAGSRLRLELPAGMSARGERGGEGGKYGPHPRQESETGEGVGGSLGV